MSSVPRLLRTVSHLRPHQVYYQVYHRLVKPRFCSFSAPTGQRGKFVVACILKPVCLRETTFEFLKLSAPFTSWNDASRGNLWCYNLNYMDWLGQEGMTEAEGVYWIDKFISDLPTIEMGLDAAPTAIRCTNWIKFFCCFPPVATPEREDCLYSQLILLERKLEYHLLANHLLEDAFALYFGASYFCDEALLDKAEQLLISELKEQILPDGAHFEQSPMYHCVMLDRLLDCCNIKPTAFLKETASKMLGHLESIIWNDKTIPLLNDSAYGIAPTPELLFDYARRLGLKWEAIPMKECGYRRMVGDGIEAIVDIGEITANYQPGHTHADLFSYELRMEGRPVVVDTGITTYDKTPRRQYERSTRAHNTVSVDGKDSFEVWGGFRVGKRARVTIEKDEPLLIEATHNGFGHVLQRRSFELQENGFVVRDSVSGSAKGVSYIHLAPGRSALIVGENMVDCGDFLIVFSGADSVSLREDSVSTQYNVFEKSTVVEIEFTGEMSYTISKK